MDALVPSLGLALLAGVPAYAWIASGRRVYATWGLIILAVSLPGAIAMHDRLVAWAAPAMRPWLDAAFVYGLLAAGAHLTHLVRARLRSSIFRVAISIPGMVFIAVGALSGLWLLALLPLRGLLWLAGLDDGLLALRWLDLVPVAIGVASVVTSLRTVEELVSVLIVRRGTAAVTGGEGGRNTCTR